MSDDKDKPATPHPKQKRKPTEQKESKGEQKGNITKQGTNKKNNLTNGQGMYGLRKTLFIDVTI